MIRRPPRSTLFPYTNALPIWKYCNINGYYQWRHSGNDRLVHGIQRRSSDRHRKRSEEHTSELQSLTNLVCRLLLEKKKNTLYRDPTKKLYGSQSSAYKHCKK